MDLEELLEPKWGPIGKEVYERTYMRYKENGEPETWFDTVARVVRGNTALVDERYIEPGEREKLMDLIYNMKAIPAGRHLWVSGVQGRQFLFNCHRAPFDNRLADHNGFTFAELMKGGGVGANYSNRYIDVVQTVNNIVRVHIVCDPEHPDYHEVEGLLSKEYSYKWDGCHRISDDREGWVSALESLCDSAMAELEDPVVDLVFDLSPIRGRGKPLQGFCGTSSGPCALAEMLLAVANVFNFNVGKKLDSLAHMLVDHEIAKAVVAGNVRRSARMSIKSWKDHDILEFIHCKKDYRFHWTTNISVEIDDDFFLALKGKKHELHDHAITVYRSVVAGMLENGEPGFYNISLASEGELGDVGSTNPCGEIALEPYENCNLGHINLDAFADDFEGSKEAFRLMTRFLMRATFGNIDDPRQAEVVARNRRIGVGIFGFQGWLVKNGIRFSDSHRNRYVRKTLRDWKSVVDKEKRRYAFQLRIPEPIKGTTVAPTGTIAKLCGATEGIHTIYGAYFIRRIRFDANDPKLRDYEDQGYHIEDCMYTANTKVVSFYCRDTLLDYADESLIEGANDVSLSDMLAVQAMVQDCYADNAVSFTVNFEPSTLTVEEAEKTFIHYLPYLKGTTVMPDGTRPQSPYERITKADYELTEYIRMTGSGELACGPNGCPVK